jgi:hypothetical protein
MIKKYVSHKSNTIHLERVRQEEKEQVFYLIIRESNNLSIGKMKAKPWPIRLINKKRPGNLSRPYVTSGFLKYQPFAFT